MINYDDDDIKLDKIIHTETGYCVDDLEWLRSQPGLAAIERLIETLHHYDRLAAQAKQAQQGRNIA
jgi:hypothetical protein